MTFKQAVSLVESMISDSAIKDRGLALQETLLYLNKMTKSTSDNPLMVIDAFEIVSAIANGPEDEESDEDKAWRAYVKTLAHEVFGQTKELSNEETKN